MSRSPLLVAACVLGMLVLSCKGSGETEPAGPSPDASADTGAGTGASPEPSPEPIQVEFDEAVYHFQDASVPPPHHRSVTITAKVGSIVRVVDSYGDEIERNEGALDEAQFRELVDAFLQAKIRPLDPGRGATMCSGGTSESVRLLRAGQQVFAGTIDHCGGSDVQDFRGDLGPLIGAMKSRAAGGPVSD